MAVYADDTAVFCQVPWKNLKKAKKILVAALESVKKFLSTWKIQLNKNKTEFIILTKSSVMIRRMDEDILNFDGSTFKWANEVKYLGIILDRKLNFRKHIETCLTKVKSLSFSTLYCLLKNGSRVNKKEKTIIYKTIIRPIMTYGCPIFNNCAKSHRKKLHVIENKILRMALNIKWDDFVTNNEVHERSMTPTLEEFCNKLTENFFNRCQDNENPLISTIGNYEKSSLEFRLKHRLPKKL